MQPREKPHSLSTDNVKQVTAIFACDFNTYPKKSYGYPVILFWPSSRRILAAWERASQKKTQDTRNSSCPHPTKSQANPQQPP